jgi:porin
MAGSAAPSAASIRMRALFGPTQPVRDGETTVELTYQAALRPWWVMQPDLSYVVHPGGNILDPTDPNRRRAIKDATVLGLCTFVIF